MIAYILIMWLLTQQPGATKGMVILCTAGMILHIMQMAVMWAMILRGGRRYGTD